MLASSGMDGTIQLWEVEGERQRALLQGHTGMMFGVALSVDGQFVASGGMDGIVRVWQVADGQPVATLCGHDGAVYSGQGSPMGKVGPVKFSFSPGKDKKGEDSDKLFDVVMDFAGAGGSESCKK